MPPKDKKKKDTRKSAKKERSSEQIWRQRQKEVIQRQSLGQAYDKLCKEVPNYKLMTPAVVSERLKIVVPWTGQPFRNSLGKDLLVSKHRTQVIYTRNTKGGDAPATGKMHEQQVPPTVRFEK